jgi:hypothetical protein
MVGYRYELASVLNRSTGDPTSTVYSLEHVKVGRLHDHINIVERYASRVQTVPHDQVVVPSRVFDPCNSLFFDRHLDLPVLQQTGGAIVRGMCA